MDENNITALHTSSVLNGNGRTLFTKGVVWILRIVHVVYVEGRQQQMVNFSCGSVCLLLCTNAVSLTFTKTGMNAKCVNTVPQ